MRYTNLAIAHAEAKQLVQIMEDKGLDVPKDQYAREALESVVAMVRIKDISHKDRLAAARTVLDYTMSKPESKAAVTVKKAEDFLTELAADLQG